jgi:hypothetical protein
MKVVNIPSTKVMKKFRAHLREASLLRLQVPIHASVLKRSAVIASAAKQSRGNTDGWIASLRSQ